MMTNVQRIAVWLVALVAVAGATLAIANHRNERQQLYSSGQVQLIEGSSPTR